MIKLILVAIVLVSLAFAGIAIKMFVHKGAEFHKSCGSVDLSTGKSIACGCGSDEKSVCENG